MVLVGVVSPERPDEGWRRLHSRTPDIITEGKGLMTDVDWNPFAFINHYDNHCKGRGGRREKYKKKKEVKRADGSDQTDGTVYAGLVLWLWYPLRGVRQSLAGAPSVELRCGSRDKYYGTTCSQSRHRALHRTGHGACGVKCRPPPQML